MSETAILFTFITIVLLASTFYFTRAFSTARKQNELLVRENISLGAECTSLRSRLELEQKNAQEKIALLEDSEKRLSREFENLANRIFEERQRAFSETSRTGIESVVTPMREQLTEFRRRVDAIYDSENRERASLRAEIQGLQNLNRKIGEEALNLTRALKGDSKVRGTWGEVQLERLLEDSGLTKGREYETQSSLLNEEGRRFQPDVIVHLPDRKDVIIDSKVSLVAYEQYFSQEDEGERQKHLKAHIQSLRNHIGGLGAKCYSELVGLNSLDMVIMFVPIEPALLLALEHDPGLFNEAFSRKILLVGPSTLMATLQIIHNIWRYELQNRNARTIAEEAGRLHDQFVSFVESLEKVGDQIRKAAESYETTHKRLVSGKGNLVARVANLQVLGAKARKSMPGNISPDSFNEEK